MTKHAKPLLDLMRGKAVNHKPIWLMRQAGRYLPEYRALREKAKNFLDFCLTPDLATEATLQPIQRFGFDGAILFADILLVPYALGQDLAFREGEGPVLEPVRSQGDLGHLVWNIEQLAPVFETLERLRHDLPPEVTRLGFAGAPWTVACYMIEGRGKQGFQSALAAAAEDEPDFMNALMEQLHRATLEYLGRQIEAGAEAVQLFDSWAGLLDGPLFQQWVIEPTQRLVEALRAEYPNIPILGFPRGATPENYRAYLRQTDVDALSLDQDIPLDFARDHLQNKAVVQGNLDPEILVQGGEPLRQAVEHILATLGPNHIFNLGHGILPQTPPEHVAELVGMVRGSVVAPSHKQAS